MKITVAGLGAIGLWLAGRLLAADHEVRCFARGATLEALQREGLRLTFEGQESATPVFATDDPKALGPVDLLLLTPKSQALPVLAAQEIIKFESFRKIDIGSAFRIGRK